MTVSKTARKILFPDEPRIWNLDVPSAGAASSMKNKIKAVAKAKTHLF